MLPGPGLRIGPATATAARFNAWPTSSPVASSSGWSQYTALTTTLPSGVTAIAGYDALSHAVEAFVTRKRNRVSALFAGDAWRLLAANFTRVLDTPGDQAARGAMLLGSHEAGIAIEQSMLGATHALANPLTAMHGTIHGVAIAVMLPHVVRWNGQVVGEQYAELLHAVGDTEATPATAGINFSSR